MKSKCKLLDILLIEDDQNDISLIKIAFENAGIDVNLKIITNGEEAINYINKLDKEEKLPDLILLDINLPKVNGLEVLQIVKSDEITSQIPTVIFTSSDSEFDMNSAYNSGANLYLKKPNNINDFRSLIVDFIRLKT